LLAISVSFLPIIEVPGDNNGSGFTHYGAV
jgi:hypothetical protein